MQKIYLLSSFCAAMAVLCSCGGETKQEPVTPEEAATVWSSEKKLTVNKEERNKEVTNYGAADEVVSTDNYMLDKESGKLYLEEHTIYQNGKPVYSNVFDEKGTIIGHNVYTYNEAGSITLQVAETYVEGLKRVAPSQRYVYEYNDNGDVTSVKDQHTIPSGWATDYEWVYSYDDQKRLSLRVDYNGDGKERKQSCQYAYTYKAGCNQFEQIDYYFYDVNFSKLRHDSKIRYEYDKKGFVKNELVIRHRANKKRDDINSRMISFTYNVEGQVTSRVERKWNNVESKWYEVKTFGYKYSNEGQLLSSIESYYTTKGLKVSEENYSPAPEGKSLKAPAALLEQIKPVVDLNDKHKTSKDED